MAPATAAVVADLILASHVAITAFVVGLLPLILVGGWRGWRWVRAFWLRGLHLALIVFIAGQAWLGELCPLTVWEQALRAQAGQASYRESFIEYWLGRLLYVDAPWWAFVAAYTGFALLVALAWRWVPPQRRRPLPH
jgi:polyferredoxin